MTNLSSWLPHTAAVILTVLSLLKVYCRPLWPVIVAFPLLYLASFGPACRAVEKGQLPQRLTSVLYRPLVIGSLYGPRWFSRPMKAYVYSFARHPWGSISHGVMYEGGILGQLDREMNGRGGWRIKYSGAP